MEEIHYLLGNKCNLNCGFCFWDFRTKDVSFKTQKKIIDQIVKAGAKKVTISGGEPTMVKGLPKVLEYMKANNLRIILHTNGLLVDKDFAGKISPFLDRISLVMDGSDEKMSYKMRGNRDIFSHTVSLAETFRQLKTNVSIKTVVTKVNQADILNIAEIVKSLPINHWSLLEFNPVNKGVTNKANYLLGHGEFQKIISKIKESFPSVKVETRAIGDTPQYCFIDCNGCVFTYRNGLGDVLIGDLTKDSLAKVLEKIEHLHTTFKLNQV